MLIYLSIHIGLHATKNKLHILVRVTINRSSKFHYLFKKFCGQIYSSMYLFRGHISQNSTLIKQY